MNEADIGDAIAVDSAGEAYVGGAAGTADFPTTPGAFQAGAAPLNNVTESHGFVTKLNASGSALVFSTYLGGTSIDQVNGR